MAKKQAKKQAKANKKPVKKTVRKASKKTAAPAQKAAKPAVEKAQKAAAHRIVPVGDRVLLRPMTESEARGESQNRFGIILPESVSSEKSAEGIILAVGEGRYVDGKLKPLSVRVGDRVLYSKYGYDEVKDGAEDLYILKEDSILAVINK